MMATLSVTSVTSANEAALFPTLIVWVIVAPSSLESSSSMTLTVTGCDVL